MSNVSVCVRFRPLNAREGLHASVAACIRRSDNDSMKFKDEKEEESTFTFDKIFYEDATQADVFECVAMPIVRDAMNAVNGTVLAYGQTGAGKTHSMEGPNMNTDDPSTKGILPRVAQSIFDFIESADETSEFLIKISMVEIYMERIRDLLDATKDNLQVKESKTEGIFVAGVTEKYVQSQTEMLQLLQNGVANRVVGATCILILTSNVTSSVENRAAFQLVTLMNAGSSRSHCVFLLTIQHTSVKDGSVKTGKIFLVDLAGSEKVEKTGAEGRLLSEAKTINKSLSALGNVINALTSDKACHIPYRDSKLTRILQESLGGNSRTTLLCCCSPSSLHTSETLSTLRFGTRAKQIRNKPEVNAQRGRHELEQILQKSEQECEHLRGQLLISNARLRSLNEGMPFGVEATLYDNSQPCISLQDKLRFKLHKRIPPTLDGVIEVLKDLFAEEGLLTDNCCIRDPLSYGCAESAMQVHELKDCASNNILGDDNLLRLVQDKTSSTITILQRSLEELVDELDKVEKENENLKLELLACVRLLPETSRYLGVRKPSSAFSSKEQPSFSKPTIVCPVRSGSLAVFKSTLPQQPKSSSDINTSRSLWRTLFTMVSQCISHILGHQTNI